ncbi:MAG: DNA polymerase III subunit beta [Candidatus Melainabacteria bacterium]|nr:DNA polymerase III subunit beta [Candidatus Melainabacteria bacterium]
MDIDVKTDFLRRVVSCATRAASSKAIQPILNNILLKCSSGSLTVLATDLDLAIECKLPAEVSRPGEITLPAKKLDEIVSKAPGENIKISIDENNIAKIFSNKAKFSMSASPPEEFPNIIQKQEQAELLKINLSEFFRALSLTSFAISRFENASILSGGKFSIENGEFELGAADGSRLARYIGKLEPHSLNLKESVVIPSRALIELEKLIATFKEGDEFVWFNLLPGQIIFQNSDFSLSTRLLNGVFPSYDKLIPKEQPNKAMFSRTLLLSSLERVAILSNDRTSVVKMLIEKDGKTAQLSANSPDYGNATDEIDVNYTGANIEIAFNYRYLTEILRNLDVESVLLELDTALSPILLRLHKEATYNYTYLIMPVEMR